MESGGAGTHPPDTVMQLTKCVTIRSFESEKPPEKWVNCFSMTSPKPQVLCNPSDWELTNISHMLLDIDIPNQQLFHLPLLITPAHCVYLVTFDLHNQRKSLIKIHSVMKNVYTLSSYAIDGSREFPPKVLLVGLHANEIEGESRTGFAQNLTQMLEKMPYNKLVDKPVGDEPFWAVNGGDLSLSESDPLLHQIKGYSSEHGPEVHQWIRCHHELQEKLKDAPCIRYCELKDMVANISPGADSLKFNEFLKFLHNYGFIFYHSPEGKEDDSVILLQPQYLYKLFAEVLNLSKKNRDRPTLAELWSGTSARIKASPLDKQWFQRICIDMGLVFEVAKAVCPEFVFLMGLEAGPSSPSRDLYSIPPLLVTFKEGGVAKEDKCLLPSHFFAAFVTEFLRTLTRHDDKPRRQGNLPLVENMEQHYVQVGLGSTYIHVVEQDFCIEIGLQQVDLRGRNTNDEKKKRGLRSFCKRVYKAATASADNIRGRLKLAEPILRYGFYHPCATEDGTVDAFGEYSWDEFEEGSILKCSCCDPGVQPTTPLQEIWFEDDFDLEKVSVRTVTTVGSGRAIRQLHEVTSSDGVQSQPTPPPLPVDVPRQRTTTPFPGAVTAEQVLKHFLYRFIGEVDARAIAFYLKIDDIISQGVEADIRENSDVSQQNQILYSHLKAACTQEALMKVCKVMIAVPGHPKMKQLGKEMKSMLEGTSGGPS